MKFSNGVLVLLILSVFRSVGFSIPVYDNNSNIRQAHQYLYALRTSSAEKILKAEEIKNPDNGYVTFYRLYSEIIRLTISNSPEQYRKSLPGLKEYIRKLEILPDNAPDYRLLLGEAKVYSGLLNVKYNSKLGGMLECLKGYNLLKDNAKKYPLFEPGKKITGIIQISVAFMPKILRWGIKLLGIKSDPRGGLKELADYSKYAKGKPGYEEEAFLFTMAAYKLMNQDEEAMHLIREKSKDFKEIALLNYIAATICLEANDTETTLLLLSNIKPEKLEIPFPPLLYLTGKAKLFRLDPDANIPLINYLNTSAGTDYIKATLYDLACFYIISGNIPEYQNYTAQVKTKGRELHNRDIEAAFEASKSDLPNIHLMRADLLVRGGYFRKAEDELSNIGDENAINNNEKVRFYYDSGECKRQRKLIRQAESAFLKAVALGNNTGDYIAQKALVESGLMMEKNGFTPEAIKYYNLCLQFKAVINPYSDLYNNKAKAGLIRLSLSE